MSINEKDENSISVKVVMIGSVGVGKSSIIARYVRNLFNEKNEPTIGANFSTKELLYNEKRVILNIWDTAGQEKFRSMGRLFYKNANIIVMVYDITKQDSFDDIKNYWYKDVKENGENYKVIGIVGNKIDLYEKEEIDNKQIKEFIEQINNDKKTKITEKKVSCLNGVNINELFNDLVSLYFSEDFNLLLKEDSRENEVKINQEDKKRGKRKCC